jgi:hypothetical protein
VLIAGISHAIILTVYKFYVKSHGKYLNMNEELDACNVCFIPALQDDFIIAVKYS